MALKLATNQTKKTAAEVFADRRRTNILKDGEQKLIFTLLKILPKWLTPNGLTTIGMIGSLTVFIAFVLAIYFSRLFLVLGIIGLVINWFGDSLDGRLAYYRQTPRKWYGFSLDIITDWIGIALIGLGYYAYAPSDTKVLGFLFVVLYGWAIIIALLRYKITDAYSIDSGSFGPTELRIFIMIILILEITIPGSISYCAGLITLLLLIFNIVDSVKLLRSGDLRDRAERL